MRTIAVVLALALLPTLAGAAGGGALMNANVDATATASLQRGAKLFVNYCMGCHSLKYLRYQRLSEDLGVPEELVQKYLIWDDSRIHDTMTNAMREADAQDWFGAAPPDLSYTVRVRGADWVYTYLNTFYRDPSQPTGVNNLVLPGASMPHVLARLQGIPQPIYAAHGEGSGKVVVAVAVPENAGALTPQEYHRVTRDITNFLAYAAEPIKAYRQQLGIYVILFLLVLLVIVYLLKREYWKDVH